MKVAVLGLGRMGRAVAGRLLDGGHDLVVWNRSGGRADELVANGAKEAGEPGEAVEAVEVAITSLADDEAVREVALGEAGVREAIGPGTYVDASTVSPSLSAELDGAFECFAALPILGAPQAVTAGEAIYLAGGEEAVLDGLGPVFGSLGGRLKRYARPELAATGKLAVNLLLLSGIATVAEALAVGRAGGLSDEELTDLLCATPMLAPGLQNRLRALVEGGGPAWWTTTLAAKDAGLAAEVGAAGGTELRLASTLAALYRAAAAAGHAHDDMVAVAALYRDGATDGGGNDHG